ncbi:hypothetical protein [Armatimonas sp.]|uniref:hypothetical protein n=1 Tax=Armatimonas sp. TaxID=1872638 RepID=UPI00286A126B|nr:hypothetical protein [Armatimonas sp.]
MRWEPDGSEPHLKSFAEFTELRRFDWGAVDSGISDDPRLPGRYIIVFRDETETPEPVNLWFVYPTPAEHHAAQQRVLRYGTDNDIQGAGVPSKPRPPRRPASNAIALEW